MKKEKIFIVVDYQRDFVNGALATKGAAELENALAARIEAFLKAGGRVFFLKDTHSENYLRTLEGKSLPVRHCLSGTEGHDLYGKVRSLEGRGKVVEKTAFGCAELPRVFAEAGAEPSEITLAGLVTDICVISNALILKAQYPETPIKIEAALCAGLTREKHEAALEVARSCQIEVVGA